MNWTLTPCGKKDQEMTDMGYPVYPPSLYRARHNNKAAIQRRAMVTRVATSSILLGRGGGSKRYTMEEGGALTLLTLITLIALIWKVKWIPQFQPQRTRKVPPI